VLRDTLSKKKLRWTSPTDYTASCPEEPGHQPLRVALVDQSDHAEGGFLFPEP